MKTMTIPDFMATGWQEERVIDKIVAHCRRHRIKYEVAGLTLVIYLTTASHAEAEMAVTAFAQAGTGIDEKGDAIYMKLLKFAKWVILIKVAIDVVKNALEGDFEAAKSRFVGLLLIYAILLGLPKAFGQIEDWVRG